jgi:hypothetical protein
MPTFGLLFPTGKGYIITMAKHGFGYFLGDFSQNQLVTLDGMQELVVEESSTVAKHLNCFVLKVIVLTNIFYLSC